MNERNERQRFEFICPEERTTEARLLLAQIEGIRLVPPSENTQKQIRKHFEAGTVEGFPIKGVAKTHECTRDVLDILSSNEIAGFSRETQIIFQPSSEVAQARSKKSKTSIQFGIDGLTVSHQWGNESRLVARFGGELHPVISNLALSNRREYKKILSDVERRLNEGYFESDEEKKLLLAFQVELVRSLLQRETGKGNQL